MASINNSTTIKPISPAPQPGKPCIPVALVYSYPLHVGGVETHLLALLQHHDATRFRFIVFAPASPEFTRAAEQRGGTVVQWQPRSPIDVLAAWRLLRLFKQDQIGLVHYHCPRSAFLVRSLTRWAHIPAVVTVQLPAYYFTGSRWSGSPRGRWLYLQLERLLNRYCTAHLIYASSLVLCEAEQLKLIRPEITSYIGNGVDLSRFADVVEGQALRVQMGVPVDEVVLLSVCRLDEQKAVDVLLHAFREVAAASDNVWLWLAGDGPLRAALEQLAQALGLATRVRFLGYRQDIPQLLLASDVFVLASLYEAMPLAILEALAAGLPCVVTDTGENALLIEEGVHGHVVPISDRAALAAALRQLVTNPVQRRAMGRAARDKAANYSDQQTVQRISAIYEQVLSAIGKQKSAA